MLRASASSRRASYAPDYPPVPVMLRWARPVGLGGGLARILRFADTGDGAARSGRRIASPHARTAAPLQLPHEGVRHEAGMAKAGNGGTPIVVHDDGASLGVPFGDALRMFADPDVVAKARDALVGWHQAGYPDVVAGLVRHYHAISDENVAPDASTTPEAQQVVKALSAWVGNFKAKLRSGDLIAYYCKDPIYDPVWLRFPAVAWDHLRIVGVHRPDYFVCLFAPYDKRASPSVHDKKGAALILRIWPSRPEPGLRLPEVSALQATSAATAPPGTTPVPGKKTRRSTPKRKAFGTGGAAVEETMRRPFPSHAFVAKILETANSSDPITDWKAGWSKLTRPAFKWVIKPPQNSSPNTAYGYLKGLKDACMARPRPRVMVTALGISDPHNYSFWGELIRYACRDKSVLLSPDDLAAHMRTICDSDGVAEDELMETINLELTLVLNDIKTPRPKKA